MAFEHGTRHSLTGDEVERCLAAALDVCAAAGRVILPHFREQIAIENKATGGDYDPVTIADKEAEATIRAMLHGRFPRHGFFGEEHGHEPGDGLTWVIDPIDGTRAFMTGMLHWGVLLALFDGTEPVLGVMHQPFTGEFFYGASGRSEYRRGSETRRLRARRCADLSDAVLACTGPNHFTAPERERFDALSRRVRMTRYGGDCYLYCLVAMGQLDLVVESGLKPYDVQALIPIVRGAGGVLTTWTGGDPAMGGNVIAAGDGRVHAAAMKTLAER